MNSNTHLQEHRQLHELLDTYGDEARTLPLLKADEGPKWLSQLLQWALDQMEAMWDWLRRVFGPLPTPQLAIDWSLVIQVLFWLLVGLLVTWLVYTLIRRRGLPKRHRNRQLPHRVDSEAATLQQALEKAIENAHWGLAARLRWRLFLARLDMQSHVTPREFFHIHRPQRGQHWDQDQGIPVGEQYRVMFSSDDGSRQWFDRYHGALAALEDERGHG